MDKNTARQHWSSSGVWIMCSLWKVTWTNVYQGSVSPLQYLVHFSCSLSFKTIVTCLCASLVSSPGFLRLSWDSLRSYCQSLRFWCKVWLALDSCTRFGCSPVLGHHLPLSGTLPSVSMSQWRKLKLCPLSSYWYYLFPWQWAHLFLILSQNRGLKLRFCFDHVSWWKN